MSPTHRHQRPMIGLERTMHARSMDRELGQLISSVRDDDHSFEIMLDVSQFTPEEIAVTTTDRNIVIHGKHAERTDQHGFVSREFRRRVMLPKGVDPDSVTSIMTPDGIITITAPKMALEGSNERVVPIVKKSAAVHKEEGTEKRFKGNGSSTEHEKPNDG